MSDRLRVVVLADTHLRTARSDGRVGASLPAAAWACLRGADAILHAGDILDAGVLELLGEMAPVHAVLGNNDVSLVGVLPTSRVVELGGLLIGMVHDSGAATGRAARMRRRFPDADVVVFGHSHTPVNEEGDSGQLLFNPGSPTQRRAQPVHTLGELRIADGVLVEHLIVPLDTSSPATRRSVP
jgi:putative phosphoesterase